MTVLFSCKGLAIASIVSLIVLVHSLYAADPSASLSANIAVTRGETITITGSYSDSDGNLDSATIYDLGPGDKIDDSGTYSSIGEAGENISGSSDTLIRNFTVPIETPLGVYTFRTDVIDSDGNISRAWIPIIIENNEPTVRVSLSNTIIKEGDSVTATAIVSDIDGSIDRVSFFRDNYLHAVDTEDPFNYTYTPQGTGLREFQAAAFDNDGGNTTSSIVTLTIIPQSNVDPTISISLSDTTITEGQSVTATAIVSDIDGSIDRVSFFRDELLHAVDTEPPYNYTYNPAGEGIHSFLAIAIDDDGNSVNSDTVHVTVTGIPLIIEGSGDVIDEDIQHSNGSVFNQVLMTGESIKIQAKPGEITRLSFMDEDEDIVQMELSGNGAITVMLDPSSFLLPAPPPRYNQEVMYVTGKPSVVIEGADSSTFFSIFTVGRLNAVNQGLFPEGEIYDAEADVTLVEVINSTGIGGMQLSNTVFSGSKGKIGVDARGVPIVVRLTIGDIDAIGNALPYLLIGEGSFTVEGANHGLRITGGDLTQTNGASIVIVESGSTTPVVDTFFSQNSFKSDGTEQPTQNIDATFINEDGENITVEVRQTLIIQARKGNTADAKRSPERRTHPLLLIHV